SSSRCSGGGTPPAIAPRCSAAARTPSTGRCAASTARARAPPLPSAPSPAQKEREKRREEPPVTTVKIRPVVEPTALYCRYENNYEPQPVYINLDLADGALYADYRATNDTPMRVWLGQVRAWKIPPLVADAANELLKDIAPLAQRILDGSSIEVNPRTGDRVGVLDDDAMAAEWEIYEIIENWHEDPTVSVVEEISV